MFKSVINAESLLHLNMKQQVNWWRTYLPGTIFVRAAGAEFVVGNSPHSGKIRRLHIQSSPYFTTESSSKS
jgi:hypothetical protein